VLDTDDVFDATPTVSSTKLLPSPELESLKLFSPFAPIKKMSPLLKSRTEAYSVLRKISAKKKDPEKADVQFPLRSHEGVTEKVTITLSGINGTVLEEDKGDVPNAVKFTRPKRVPFIDKTGVADLVTSPLISTEGIRLGSHGRAASMKEDPRKQSTMTVCACGNECKEVGNMCPICLEKLKTATTTGYLYEKIDAKTLNRYWYTLVGNHLYSNGFEVRTLHRI